ncbi:NUDIX hydrolase [Deinococcus caeni]|uniref:NUDIX hydrolase n=1 Tax=Deinococcus caeni TaxID=569127 RepID=UPI00360DC8FB
MTRPAFLNLSPGLDRVGRACAWIEREDGFVLMTGLEWGGWTLPGGGIHPGETPAQAAVREAWEEAGAHAEVAGDPFPIVGVSGVESICVPLHLTRLEPSPEGRPVTWVNPRSLPWAEDHQLRQVLAARGQTPAHLRVPPLVQAAQAVASPDFAGVARPKRAGCCGPWRPRAPEGGCWNSGREPAWARRGCSRAWTVPGTS